MRHIGFIELSLLRPESGDNDVPPHEEALLQHVRILGCDIIPEECEHGTNACSPIFERNVAVPQSFSQSKRWTGDCPDSVADLSSGVPGGCSSEIRKQSGQMINNGRAGDDDVCQRIARVGVPELFAFRMIEEERHELVKTETPRIESFWGAHGRIRPAAFRRGVPAR